MTIAQTLRQEDRQNSEKKEATFKLAKQFLRNGVDLNIVKRSTSSFYDELDKIQDSS
ncbi:hypothetical protein [Arsenophonus sp.]|uniref:hypothetical protein n=1 Tax=Arsenophonus sp. TaxID=1872640 RepID=UPI00387A7625